VTCWGSSQFATTHVPEGIYRQVSVGDTFVCGLRETGSIICWGYAGLHATQAPKGTFTQVSAGVGSACGLRSNGRVACWGDITGSQGEHLPRHPAGTFSQISAGIGFGCGLRADASIACWGTALLADQTSYSAYRGTPVTNVPAGIFKQLSSGGTFACGMRTIGSVTCWGEFTRDQSKVPGGIFTQISAGQDYACGMRRTGMIACWGYGGSGATMVPTPASYMPPPRGNPPGVHYFRLTHHSVAHAFLVFYNAREGSLLFGLPLTEAFSEGGALVQYFEHSRLVDSHGHISITPLGVYVTKNRLFAPELQRTILGRLWFPATGHTLSGAFLTFWQTHHGALVFGSPLSEPLHEQHVNGIDRT